MTEKAKETVRMSWGTLIQVSLILATVLLSFANVKGDTESNAVQIREMREDVDENKDLIHLGELQNVKVLQQQQEILRRLDENRNYYEKAHSDMMSFIKNFEVDE